jgi:hypothetical protein
MVDERSTVEPHRSDEGPEVERQSVHFKWHLGSIVRPKFKDCNSVQCKARQASLGRAILPKLNAMSPINNLNINEILVGLINDLSNFLGKL